MGENPALFKNRKKSIDDFEVGDEVKVWVSSPSDSPGIDMDENAIIGKVEAKDKKTITVDGKKYKPSDIRIFKKGGRRTRKARRRQTRRR